MNHNQLLTTISEIGRLLLKHGAEVYRVEESLERMLQAYGYRDIEVFAIPTYFSLSVMLDDNTPYTVTKRTRQNRINLDSLYALNNLVRKISENTMSNTEIKTELDDINNVPLKMPLIILGYGLCAGFFTVFFGGGLQECILGGIIGFIVYFIIWLMETLDVNTIVSTLLASIALATLAITFDKLGWVHDFEAITIGCLMVLVPGVAITNSLRDIIGGEFVSGIARMVEAILTAASIAIGVGIMIIVFGG